MKLDEKRKVVELLLCGADRRSILNAADDFGIAGLLVDVALTKRMRVNRDWIPSDEYRDSCLEAAYRLIESSATLRREWFGGAR